MDAAKRFAGKQDLAEVAKILKPGITSLIIR